MKAVAVLRSEAIWRPLSLFVELSRTLISSFNDCAIHELLEAFIDVIVVETSLGGFLRELNRLCRPRGPQIHPSPPGPPSRSHRLPRQTAHVPRPQENGASYASQPQKFWRFTKRRDLPFFLVDFAVSSLIGLCRLFHPP